MTLSKMRCIYVCVWLDAFMHISLVLRIWWHIYDLCYAMTRINVGCWLQTLPLHDDDGIMYYTIIYYAYIHRLEWMNLYAVSKIENFSVCMCMLSRHQFCTDIRSLFCIINRSIDGANFNHRYFIFATIAQMLRRWLANIWDTDRIVSRVWERTSFE